MTEAGFRRRAVAARLRDEAGTTVIETAVASTILLVMLAGLMSIGAVSTMHTENQGHLAARTTEYAQDKMEQLLALAYSDSLSDTVVFPTASSGGSGLAVGGGTNTSAPVDKYVDWLGADGSLLGGGTSAPSAWFYERVWQISALTSNVKQITVTVTVKSAVANSWRPASTVVALKASQF